MSTPQTHTPAWAKGMRKLGPGIYLAGTTLHVSEAEMCEHFGVPFTRENVETIERAVTEGVQAIYPGAKLRIVEHNHGS